MSGVNAVSAYEQKRLDKIAASKLALAASGILAGIEAVEKSLPVAPVKAPTKRRAPKKLEPAEPKRRSSRQSGMETTEADLEVAREAEAVQAAIEFEESQVLKHGDRELVAQRSITDSGSTKSLVRKLAELSTYPSQPRSSPSKSKSLDDVCKGVKLRGLEKVCPERIYSLAVHPSTSRDLVFAGDKIGMIGLWDCTDSITPNAAGPKKGGRAKMDEDEEEGEEDDEGVVKWYWQAHGKNSIPCLKFSPTDPDSIYSGSYDCTVRSANFVHGSSTEVINADAFTAEGLIHSFDFTASGHEVWASDNNGGLIHRDLREPISAVQRWEIDVAKVGTVSINPMNPHLAVTAHLKREMKIWDLRKLSSTPPDGTPSQIKQACVGSYEHAKACSSAYFDPSGTRILSTCYDDRLRLFDVSPERKTWSSLSTDLEPRLTYKHDCQVGRYVSVFKAQWSTSALPIPHFTVGDMKRFLDVYDTEKNTTTRKLYDGEHVTAVPAITASHPSRAGRFYGATGAGKVSFFAALD